MKVLKPKRLLKVTLFLFYYGLRLLIEFPVKGGICLAVSVMLLLTVGGFEDIIEKPFEDTEQYKDCIFGKMYDLKERLRRERQDRERYWMEQAMSWKKSVWGGIIYLLFFLITATALEYKSDAVLWFCGEIFTVGGEFWGLTWIWDSYINSGAVYAKEISKKFMIHSTSVKIEESSKIITALQKKICEQEEALRSDQ